MIVSIDHRNLAKSPVLRSREEYGICRSRKALSDEYLIVAIGVDTAANGSYKIWDRKTGVHVTKTVLRMIEKVSN